MLKLIFKRLQSTTALKDLNVINSSKFVINSVLPTGFKVNHEKIQGPLIIVGNQTYNWDVPMYGVGGPIEVANVEHEWNEKSSPFYGWNTDMLYLFEYLKEQPELLLIGTGQNLNVFPPFLRDYVLSLGIKLEVLNTVSIA